MLMMTATSKRKLMTMMWFRQQQWKSQQSLLSFSRCSSGSNISSSGDCYHRCHGTILTTNRCTSRSSNTKSSSVSSSSSLSVRSQSSSSSSSQSPNNNKNSNETATTNTTMNHTDHDDDNYRTMMTPPSLVLPQNQFWYGSLHDAGGNAQATSRHDDTATTSSIGDANNHTTSATTSSSSSMMLIQELIQEQSNTIQQIVPWFLANMPTSYFVQIPLPFQYQHIKAIISTTMTSNNSNNTGQQLSINLLPAIDTDSNNDRHVYTYIRPSTQPGTLLQIVSHELPSTTSVPEPLLLSRIHFFATKDASLSLNMFIYGPPQIIFHKLQQQQHLPSTGMISPEDYVRHIGKPIFDYVANAAAAAAATVSSTSPTISGNDDSSGPKVHRHRHPVVGSMVWEEQALVNYMVHHCTETYIRIGNTNPYRFLRQWQLVQAVSGNDDMMIDITPCVNGMKNDDDDDDDEIVELVPNPSTDATNNHGSNPPPPSQQCHYWIDVAVSNSISQVVLQNLCHLLYIHNFDIVRARLDVIPPVIPDTIGSRSNSDGDHTNSSNNDNDEMVTLLRTLVTSNVSRFEDDVYGNSSGSNQTTGNEIDGQQQQSIQNTFDTLIHEMKRSKWIDPMTHELVYEKHPQLLDVTRGEIITGLIHVIHPILLSSKQQQLSLSNSMAQQQYSIANIYTIISNPRFITYALDIANLLLDRFNPSAPLSSDKFQFLCTEIGTAIDRNVEDTVAIAILHTMIYMVQHTLKTNVYMPDRYALSFRFNPEAFANHKANTSATLQQVPMSPATTISTTTTHEQPYGIFFVHGRRFNGYHVRFRDIARGGLRLVTPSTPEQYAFESSKQYEECYGLAYAQQLKNKDIPEGGSKAVVLIQSYGLPDTSKSLVMRKSVRAMTDAILDLIVETDYTKQYMVDLWGHKEVIYLGPDEQVIPADIEWIVKRAAVRGYDTPAAFMSSKPRAGINHKVYGVTSEGVNVYLDVALRTIFGIDPTKEPFTVKITGGPDGDVAGNEIKILIREYGTNVKFVGIADHSGCVEDPINGLDHTELLRLFHSSLCISHFDPSKLSPTDGVKYTVDTPDGVTARNSMHNRLDADIFVPCGGRPNTIDGTNYKQFLKADGCTPSSKLIVEGANLFITSEARKALFDDGGVMIVKDSSANKGGVITSSYEICAAMLLSEDEFFDHKEQIVQEVLDKLRGFAKLEADLLFREFDEYEGLSLPEVSQIISNCINTTTDALHIALESLPLNDVENTDILLPLFRSHLPKTIADLAFDRLHSHVPDQYVKNAIASCLASKIVYKEGTKFITSLPPKQLAKIALDYIHNEKEIAVLLESLNGSNMTKDDKIKVYRLLDNGGARTALKFLPKTKM